MIQKDTYLNKFNEYLNKITNPRIVKISIYVSLLTFLPGLLIGVIIASNFGPEGYHIWDNYISDLGSFRFTPTPWILDIIAMITAIFIIPTLVFSTKILVSGSRKIIFDSNVDMKKRIFYVFNDIIAIIGLFWLIVGAIGLFGIGLFSEDRTTELNLHFLFSIIVFSGLALGALFNGLAILIKKSHIPRLLGLYMIFVPSTVSVLFVFPPTPYTVQFLEWMMLFSNLVWLLHITGLILRHLNRK